MIEIIAVFFNFAIVCFLLWHYGRKPMADFLAQRSQTIGDQMKEAIELSREAQRELSEWQARWKEAEAAINRQFEDAQKSVIKFKDALLAHARAEGERIQNEARLVGQSEMAKAQLRLRQELVTTSVATARRYLSEHLDKKDKIHLVTEYLEAVPNGHAR